MLPICFQPAMDGVELYVYCAPGAAKEKIGDVVDDGQGQMELKIYVTAPPEDGKANKAIVKLLSKQWDIAKSKIQILRGESSRHKKILLIGDVGQLQNQLQIWYQQAARN